MRKNKNILQDFLNLSLSDKLLIIGITAAGAVVVGKYIRKLKEQKIMNQYGNDMNVQHAVSLNNAMNPSGNNWMRNFDGTDEAGMYQIAEKITNWPAVVQAYQTLYNRNLIDDINSELDSSELDNFNAILNKTKTASEVKTSNKSKVYTENISAFKQGIAVYAIYNDVPVFVKRNNVISKWGVIPKAGNYAGKIVGIWKATSGSYYADVTGMTDQSGNILSETKIIHTANITINKNNHV